MAQTAGFNCPWHHQFWHRDVQFSPGRITVATKDIKLNDGVWPFLTKSDFLIIAFDRPEPKNNIVCPFLAKVDFWNCHHDG
jgi:hypothetical protein